MNFEHLVALIAITLRMASMSVHVMDECYLRLLFCLQSRDEFGTGRWALISWNSCGMQADQECFFWRSNSLHVFVVHGTTRSQMLRKGDMGCQNYACVTCVATAVGSPRCNSLLRQALYVDICAIAHRQEWRPAEGRSHSTYLHTGSWSDFLSTFFFLCVITVFQRWIVCGAE